MFTSTKCCYMNDGDHDEVDLCLQALSAKTGMMRLLTMMRLTCMLQVEDGKLEVKDRELLKQLHLTTADLRFSELLVRVVTEEKSNMYLDGTGEAAQLWGG